jgi:hypothetical protein
MSDPITHRIPDEGEILISDADIPFTVTKIDNGRIFGITPDGREVDCSIESEPHQMDEFDL